MNSDCSISIDKPIKIFHESEYTFLLVYDKPKTSVVYLNLKTGEKRTYYIDIIADAIKFVQKSGNYMLVHGNKVGVISGTYFTIEQPGMNSIRHYTICGKYLLEINGRFGTLVDCEKMQRVDHRDNLPHKHILHVEIGHGFIVLCLNASLCVIKIFNDSILMQVHSMQNYFGHANRSIFYRSANHIMEFLVDSGEISNRGICEISYPNYKAGDLTLGSRPQYVNDGRRKINIYDGIHYDNLHIRPEIYSCINDTVAYYKSALHILNWKHRMFDIHWNFVTDETRQFRIAFMAFLRFRCNLPVPILTYILNLAEIK